MSMIAHVEPAKVLPMRPAHVIGIDAKYDCERLKTFADVLARALHTYVPMRFPQYTRPPSVLVISRLYAGGVYPASSVEILEDMVISTAVENIFELDDVDYRAREKVTNPLPMRTVLRHLSSKFDFILLPMDNEGTSTSMSDVTLQVTSLEDHTPSTVSLSAYYRMCTHRSNGVSVITVPEYIYATDQDFTRIYNVRKYEVTNTLNSPSAPFCTFLRLSAISGEKIHDESIVRLVDAAVTGKVASNPFVLATPDENLFVSKSTVLQRAQRVVRAGTSLTKAGVMTLAGGGTVTLSAATVLPGIVTVLPGGSPIGLSVATGVVTALCVGAGRILTSKGRRKIAMTPHEPYPLPSSATHAPAAPYLPSLGELSKESAPSDTQPYKTVPLSPVENQVMSESSSTHWQQVLNRYQAVVDNWLEYEVDILKTIEYPLMSDITCVHTANFHRAMNNAQMYKPTDIPNIPVDKSPFFKAVQDLEIAFVTAEQHAKKSRWSSLDDAQKQSLKTSKNLVALALDEGASLHERQSAYKQARAKLEGIIFLPDRAIYQIERTVRMEIEA